MVVRNAFFFVLYPALSLSLAIVCIALVLAACVHQQPIIRILAPHSCLGRKCGRRIVAIRMRFP